MCVGSLDGVTYRYLRYTVLTSSNKSETAVHCSRDCCHPALSVLVMLVSRNVFHVVSALQSFAFIHILFWLIRSLVDPTLAVFIVCGPLQLVNYSLVILPGFAIGHVRYINIRAWLRGFRVKIAIFSSSFVPQFPKETNAPFTPKLTHVQKLFS